MKPDNDGTFQVADEDAFTPDQIRDMNQYGDSGNGAPTPDPPPPNPVIVLYPERWNLPRVDALRAECVRLWGRHVLIAPADVATVRVTATFDPSASPVPGELISRRDWTGLIMLALQALTVVLLAILLTGCARRETPAQTATTASSEAAKQEEGEPWKGANTTTTPGSRSSASTSTASTDASPSKSTATNAASGASKVSLQLRETARDGASPMAGARAFTPDALTAPAVERCIEPRKGQTAPPPCVPPANFIKPDAPVPYNAPVTFLRESQQGNGLTHVFAKAGEPSRPCTAAEAREFPVHCGARVGDPLYEIGRIRTVTASARLSAESLRPAPIMPRVAVVTGKPCMRPDPDPNSYNFCGPRWTFVAIDIAELLTALDRPIVVTRYPQHRVTPFWAQTHSGKFLGWPEWGSWVVIPLDSEVKELDFTWLEDSYPPVLPKIRIADIPRKDAP